MVSVGLYAAFLIALGAERIVELLISARHARLAFAQGGVEWGQGHFGTMKVLHTLFPIACLAEVVLLGRPFPGAVGWIALVGALLSQALRYWAISTLGPRWNTRVIVVPGGEPVTNGPYRFIRHPNYVAVMAEMVCIPLIHGAWLTAVVFSLANAVLLRVRIKVEEQAWGDAYARAFESAPRFIPGRGARG